MFVQFDTSSPHFSLQIGSLQMVLQGFNLSQSLFSKSFLQTVAQCGFWHSIWQAEIFGVGHCVWQIGGLHKGLQVWLHGVELQL
jgi:hypothetical protein